MPDIQHQILHRCATRLNPIQTQPRLLDRLAQDYPGLSLQFINLMKLGWAHPTQPTPSCFPYPPQPNPTQVEKIAPWFALPSGLVIRLGWICAWVGLKHDLTGLGCTLNLNASTFFHSNILICSSFIYLLLIFCTDCR